MALFQFHILYLLLLSINIVHSQWIVENLPGFAGDLPFTLETGYIGVGEQDEVQFFYYFIESERSPEDDPLLLWLTGGPGCSAFSGLVYEVGPLKFNYSNSKGNKPTFEQNRYSWTNVANIIFLDQPVGTGFSYATTSQGYEVSDTLAAQQIYVFLKKWFMVHTNFLTNQLYIAGDSYAGIILPMVVELISNGNGVGHFPPLNLQVGQHRMVYIGNEEWGYILGNPLTDELNDLNSRVLFAYQKALISSSLYEQTAKGKYLYPDPKNTKCIRDINLVAECTNDINSAQILEPYCGTMLHPKPNTTTSDRRSLLGHNLNYSHPWTLSKLPKPWCREYNYIFSDIWANDKTVQEALHVREGTIDEWLRCNKTLPGYTYDVFNTVNYHRNLSKKPYQALIYSGDHDKVIPYIGTHDWIESLNLTVYNDWRPWFVKGQVAGYTMSYDYNSKYHLTFATVKGAGHTAPEYKPEECLHMIDRWLARFPL